MQHESHQVANPHDGELLPMDAMAVRPYFEEDLAALVAQVAVIERASHCVPAERTPRTKLVSRCCTKGPIALLARGE